MSSLANYIRQKVSVRAFYDSIFEVVWPAQGTEARVKSPFREERTPSFSLNPDTGAWYDHGVGEGGQSIISFYAKFENVDVDTAAIRIFQEFVHPVIPDDTVEKMKRKLWSTPSFVKYIMGRHIAEDVIKQFSLGSDGDRIVFPIKNEFGLFVNAKLYKPGGNVKFINWTDPNDKRPFGSPPMLYPLSVIENTPDDEPIWIVEGEWDMASLISLGVMAVTSTTGCKSWPFQYNDKLRGRDIVVCYDNDKDGTLYDAKVIKNLLNIARSIRQVRVPKSVGKDANDWIKKDPNARKANHWQDLAKAAELIVENPGIEAKTEVVTIALDQASRAEFAGKRICVDALVTGKDTAPYILPKKVRITCTKACDSCPLKETNKPFREKEFDPSDPSVLEMIDAPKSIVKRTVISAAGMPCKEACKTKVDVVESFNIEQLLLIPSLDSESKQYVMRSAYYSGHGLQSNRTYRLQGVTAPDPSNQHSTHLFDKAVPVQDEVDTFQLTDDLRKALRGFATATRSEDGLLHHLYAIADWQSRNITKIIHRPDLHVAVDLVFHSVRGFSFNGEVVRRGMLDVLVLGDTRCGKGFVAEGLAKYYGLGEVASGENCSFAGLVGGCENVGKRFIIKWGLFPLNDGRLVVVDEASAIATEDFGKMSRVRSEGVAEVNKIVRESTRANVRLLWLSNTRSGRPVMSYNSGIQAIKELIGANEDISRFDFALTVANNEVKSEDINRARINNTADHGRYPRELCRALVLWAWSRHPDDVVFESGATEAIISTAIEFGKTYSSAIPLVQSENFRIKLAKISAAVAARTFSTDDACVKVIVRRHHVLAAKEFLHELYTKPSMAYDSFSSSTTKQTVLVDEKQIDGLFNELAQVRKPAIQGLLSMNHVTSEGLTDYVGDTITAKTLLSNLVLMGCVSRFERGNWYMKSQPFTTWLREQEQ